MDVLALSHIEKAFGGVRALRGADFRVREGEIHALCGENGAGKSTLLKIATGVHPAETFTGEIRVRGTAHAFRSTRDAEDAGIAIVHQELMLVPELSVAQNLMLGREPGSYGVVDDDAMEAEARRFLERFGVSDDLEPTAAVGTLGIGLQQIVEIVRALSRDAKILILDEPTAALTARESDRLMDWLRDLRRRGTTSIYVSHRMDEIFSLCDRVTVLRDGRTVGVRDIGTAESDEIVAMMVGRSVATGARARPESVTDRLSLRVSHVRVPLSQAETPSFAVNDVSFSVRAGEVVAVCGAMGAGRTALLSALFGVARFGYSGEVEVSGREVALSSPRVAIAEGLALVPEDRKGRGLVLGMTVAENLALPPSRSRVARFFEWLGLVDDDEEERLAARRIEELKIRGLASAEVATLSGGNQQKVVLGKWLEHPPAVLLLDEPTRGVDVGAREEIYGLVERLTAKGTAVLLASSDLPEVLRLAHRVLVLRHGRVVAELDAGRTTEGEIVSYATGAAAARPAEPSAIPNRHLEVACQA